MNNSKEAVQQIIEVLEIKMNQALTSKPNIINEYG